MWLWLDVGSYLGTQVQYTLECLARLYSRESWRNGDYKRHADRDLFPISAAPIGAYIIDNQKEKAGENGFPFRSSFCM